MRAYYLAADEKLFTLIVTWKDPKANVLYEQVQSSLTNTFRLASMKPPVVPVAAAATTTASVVSAEKTPVPVTPASPAITPAEVKVVPTPKPAVAPATSTARPSPAPVTEGEKRAPTDGSGATADSRTEAEWNAALAMLKFNGAMKMGGQQMAMVNDKFLRKGDTISVLFHGKEFVFIVREIGANRVDYTRSPNPETPP